MRNITRRGFLQGAAAGLAGVAALGVSGGVCAEELAQGFTMDAEKAQASWSFEIAPDAITDIAEDFEADLVVVGAGTAGLITANSAIDEGLSVILVSASEKPVSRGGSNNAVYSKAHEAAGLPRIDPAVYAKEIYAQSCMVDQQKWYKYYGASEESMNWCIDIMESAGYKVVMEKGTPGDPNSLYYQPTASVGWDFGEGMTPPEDAVFMTGMMQPLLVDELARRLVEKGGQIFFKTIGKQLVRGGVANGGEGRVEAVICQREDGTYARYSGKKAVVLATGDFSANREMMHKYCPKIAPYIADAVYDGETNYDIGFQYGGLYKGEGQQMGLWVGAAWQKHQPNCPMSVFPMPGPNMFYGNHPGLQVNRNGQRFMNENASSILAGETGHLQPGSQVYAIWDTSFASNYSTSSSWQNETVNADVAATIASWEEKVELGQYVKADTLEELFEKIGLPASTLKTVERYNELARNGEDTDFYKDPSLLFEIKEAPFYAEMVPEMCVFLTVLGGLRTNVNMQVCDENDEPIPGLYNVGTMAGDMFAGVYTFQIEGGNYGMNCITYGYLTGKYIAANE